MGCKTQTRHWPFNTPLQVFVHKKYLLKCNQLYMICLKFKTNKHTHNTAAPPPPKKQQQKTTINKTTQQQPKQEE